MWMPGVRRGDRAELAADAVGRIGLEVEAVVLRQAAGQEDVDHRPGPRAAGRGLLDRVSPDERLEVFIPSPSRPIAPACRAIRRKRSGDG